MEKRLTDKVAIVTGASRGIGRAISISLAKEDATVILTARNSEKLKETAALITEAGGKYEILPVELTDEQSIKDLVKTIQEKFSRLDILINNAGVTHSAAFEDTDTDAWNKCLNTNARGPFILIREALPLLKKASGPAYIVNISSVVGVKGYPLQSAYTASKHALRGMTISLAEELRGTNVQVRLICPGGVRTEMVTKVRPDIKTDELIDPAEIAELVVYLVTHKGNGVIDEIHIRRQTSIPWF